MEAGEAVCHGGAGGAAGGRLGEVPAEGLQAQPVSVRRWVAEGSGVPARSCAGQGAGAVSARGCAPRFMCSRLLGSHSHRHSGLWAMAGWGGDT